MNCIIKINWINISFYNILIKVLTLFKAVVKYFEVNLICKPITVLFLFVL